MGNFAYIALDRNGQKTSGSLAVESRSAAMDWMNARGLVPVSLQEQGGDEKIVLPVHTGRVSQSSVEGFTRELANLLAAGLPLARALQLLRREASQPAAKKVWGEIHDDVVGGMSLADALARWPKAFSPVYVAMVRAGETGGFLSLVLQQIADFRSREQDLKGRVKAALIYPLVLATLASGVMIFLLTYFIPKFSDTFATFGNKLPLLTRIVMALSHMVLVYGPIGLVLVVFAVLGLRRAFTTSSGRLVIERTMLRIPGFGRVTARFALVRFCRMLGTLLGAGVPLVAALRVAREAIGNQTLSDAVAHATEEVQRGAPLSRSLAACPQLFPGSVIEMITIAEETGRLDKELQRLSQTYEVDLDRELRILVALAEPALLLVMAAVIGTIVVSMILPIFMMQDLIH